MERLNERVWQYLAIIYEYLPVILLALLLFVVILTILWSIFHFKELFGPVISWYMRAPKFLTRWEVYVQKRRQRRAEVDELMTDLYSDLLDEAELAGLLSRKERKREAQKLAKGRNLPELLPSLTEELQQRKTKGVIKKRMMVAEQRNAPVPLPDANKPRGHTLRSVIGKNSKPK